MPDPTSNGNNDNQDTKDGAGGNTAGEGAGTNTGGDGSGGNDDGGDEQLGAGGEAALKAERDARRAAERELRQARAKLEEAERAKLGDTERAVAEAAAKARTEALTEVNKRLLAAEAKAAAAGKLANPALAARLLDLDEFMPADGEEIDGERLAAAIDDLVKAEPYLAVQTTSTTTDGTAGGSSSSSSTTNGKPAGSVAGGARGDSTVTFKRSQLRDPSFYEANKDAILRAASEGRIVND